MKITLAMTAAFLVIGVAPVAYNEMGPETCRVTYDTSFNGLYIIKQRVFRGALGMETERTELERREMFTRF